MAGNERYEYMQRLAGKEPWEDLQPVVLTARGTTKNPIVIKGADPERYIACTGNGASSLLVASLIALLNTEVYSEIKVFLPIPTKLSG